MTQMEALEVFVQLGALSILGVAVFGFLIWLMMKK